MPKYALNVRLTGSERGDVSHAAAMLDKKDSTFCRDAALAVAQMTTQSLFFLSLESDETGLPLSSLLDRAVLHYFCRKHAVEKVFGTEGYTNLESEVSSDEESPIELGSRLESLFVSEQKLLKECGKKDRASALRSESIENPVSRAVGSKSILADFKSLDPQEQRETIKKMIDLLD